MDLTRRRALARAIPSYHLSMLVDTGLPQTFCAPKTIHNVGSPSARGAFSFPSTHTPSLGFSPGLVSRPSSKFRGRKPGLCLPLDFCPNFSVFSFFWGGHPTTRNLLCSPLPGPKFRSGSVRRERGWEGGGVYSFFRSRSRRGGPFKRTNRGAKKTGTEASGTEAP